MAHERQDVAALRAVQDEINQGRIQLYRNAINQPFVSCHLTGYPNLRVPLFHRDFRGWLCHFVWKEKTLLLHEREVDRILELLSGQSLSTQLPSIGSPELLEMLEQNPLLATIVEFMEGRGRSESTMSELWNQLREFAREKGLLGRMASRFPGGPNVLCRRLKHLRPWLKRFNISVEIHRSNGSQVVLTERKDDSRKQPSGESSGEKSNDAKDK